MRSLLEDVDLKFRRAIRHLTSRKTDGRRDRFRPLVELIEDRVLLSTNLISINAAGTAAGNSFSDRVEDQALSPDGRYVAFGSLRYRSHVDARLQWQ